MNKTTKRKRKTTVWRKKFGDKEPQKGCAFIIAITATRAEK